MEKISLDTAKEKDKSCITVLKKEEIKNYIIFDEVFEFTEDMLNLLLKIRNAKSKRDKS